MSPGQVNFAQTQQIQTLLTAHAGPIFELQYAFDSEHLLSASEDRVQVWCKEVCGERGTGAMEEVPQYTHRTPARFPHVGRLCSDEPARA